MKVQNVTVTNEIGLRGRVATIFVAVASEFKPTTVRIRTDSRQINGQSLLGVLSANIIWGTTFKIITDGPKEDDAMKALVELIESGFRDY